MLLHLHCGVIPLLQVLLNTSLSCGRLSLFAVCFYIWCIVIPMQSRGRGCSNQPAVSAANSHAQTGHVIFSTEKSGEAGTWLTDRTIGPSAAPSRRFTSFMRRSVIKSSNVSIYFMLALLPTCLPRCHYTARPMMLLYILLHTINHVHRADKDHKREAGRDKSLFMHTYHRRPDHGKHLKASKVTSLKSCEREAGVALKALNLWKPAILNQPGRQRESRNRSMQREKGAELGD